MGLSVETLVLAKKYTDEQIKNSGESVDLSALKEYIDLPFEESFSDTLTLDGDSTGLILYSSYYKVLDIEITEEDLIKGGSYSLFYPSNETIQEWTFTENDITLYLENSSILSIKGGTIIVVIEDNNFLGVNFTKGIYIDKLFYGETALTSYVISLTINGFNKFSSRVLKDSYLPDVPSPIQPDWNQNDESAPDYIKNRPFYSTGEYGYIEMLNTSAIGKLGAFYFIRDTNIVLEEDQNYQIIINKKNEYFCTGYKDADGYISLGEIDTDSFLIQSAGDMIFIDVQDGLTITNLQINKAVEQIQYLDKKYVANFIAGEKTVNQEVQYKEKTYICKEGAEKFNIGNIAIGLNSHAEGSNSVALGANSHAEGSHTEALEENSHAEGGYTQALSFYSHAEGGHTIASGQSAHAEGFHTQALNFFSHAEGEHTIANAICLHVQGRYNIPDDAPAYSRTWAIWSDYPKYDGDKVIYIFNDEPIFNANEGTSTIVTMPYQSSIKDLKKNDYFVFSYPESEIIDTYYCATELVSQETNSEGKTLYKWKYSGASYSSNLNEGTYLHIVGNGDYVYDEDLKTHVEKRSNAHTLDWDGNAWFAGDVYVGSTSGVNRDEGSKKLATEDFVNEQVNDAVAEKLGGTVEITSDNPSKANTVMTIDPSADEINVYSADEVDDMVKTLDKYITDQEYAINALTGNDIDTEYYKTVKNYSVTPEMFGAVGDGVTDDTNALKQCFLQDKPVYLSGNYRITEDLYVTRRNFNVFGKTGAYSVTSPTLYFENASLRINSENAANLRMRGFAIRSNTICLLIDGNERIGNTTFEDIYFIGNKCLKMDVESGYNWFIDCDFSTFVDTSTTDDCLIDLRYTGDSENRLNYVYFERCNIGGTGIPDYMNSGTLFKIGNCSNINITNCDICNCDTAIAVDTSIHGSQYIKITNNYIWNVRRVIDMSGLNHSLFVGNNVMNKSGQPLLLGNTFRNNAVVGNTFDFWTKPTVGTKAGDVFKGNVIYTAESLERIAPRDDLIMIERTYPITLNAGESDVKTLNMRRCYVDTLYITCSDKDITHTSVIDGTNFNVTLTNPTTETKEFLMFVH